MSKNKMRLRTKDKKSVLTFFREGDNYFVQESYNITVIGPVNITRQCNTRRYGDLDKYITELVPKALKEKPIKIIFPRWYEYRNIHTYLSYGDYSIGITMKNEDDNMVMYLDTRYHLLNKNYENKYMIDDEEKLENLVELFG